MVMHNKGLSSFDGYRTADAINSYSYTGMSLWLPWDCAWNEGRDVFLFIQGESDGTEVQKDALHKNRNWLSASKGSQCVLCCVVLCSGYSGKGRNKETRIWTSPHLVTKPFGWCNRIGLLWFSKRTRCILVAKKIGDMFLFRVLHTRHTQSPEPLRFCTILSVFSANLLFKIYLGDPEE